jgi:O-antigen/teichoic acid export membrane protein
MSYASTLQISRDRSLAQRLVSNLLAFQLLLSLVTLALCLGLGARLFQGPTWTAVLLLSLDLVLKVVKSTLRFLLKSLELFGTEAASLLIERGLILGLALAALHAGYGMLGFVSVFVLVRIFDSAGLALYVDRRILPLRLSAELKLWGELLRKGLPFAYAGAMILLFFQLDQVLLEQWRGPLEVGWYAAPVRVLEGLTLVPRILGYALIPTMAALYPRSPDAVTALYARGSKYLLVTGLPIAAFGALESGPFVRFLFGDAYAPSALAARVLIPAAAFMFLSNFGETALACVNRWGTIVAVSTACLALNVALNLAWIPRYGYVGAAWATLATEAAYFAAGAAALSRFGHRIGWLGLAARPLAATAVFALALVVARGLPLLWASALASLAYGIATLALGVWDRKEWELLLGLLRR